MTKKRVLQSLSLTLFVFGFAGWIYIVINSEVHPWTLGMQLTHFWKYPHEDTFGEMCFAVSLISFFVYQLVRDRTKLSRQSILLTKNKTSN
jgi:heme O synthase-like polyprenyltransferase